MESTNTELLVIYAILFILVFTVSWIISVFAQKAAARKQEAEAQKRRRKSMAGGLFGLLVFLLVGLAVMIFMFNQAYHNFTREELIATIQCRPAITGDADFELILIPADGSDSTRRFLIQGDQWRIGGDILIWEDYMSFLGLNSMYRLTRLQGQYVSARDEQVKPRSVHSLVETERSEFWEGLFQNAVRLPLVKSAFQEWVSSYPFYGDTFELTVTPKGYLLERIEAQRR